MSRYNKGLLTSYGPRFMDGWRWDVGVLEFVTPWRQLMHINSDLICVSIRFCVYVGSVCDCIGGFDFHLGMIN